MLFDRRTPAGFKEKMRVAVWPRRNWTRSVRYILTRLSRLRTSPHSIAIGAAIGVLMSFTPFLGFHILLAGLLAFALRGSVVAAALGTFFGNPLTYPFIWVGSYQLGSRMLGGEAQLDGNGLVGHLKEVIASLAKASFETIWTVLETLWPVMLKPMVVGSVPMGFVAGLVSYYFIKKLVDSYQHHYEASISV